jgi:hypothetical protein
MSEEYFLVIKNSGTKVLVKPGRKYQPTVPPSGRRVLREYQIWLPGKEEPNFGPKLPIGDGRTNRKTDL